MNYHPFELFVIATILVFLIQATSHTADRARTLTVLFILEKRAADFGGGAYVHARRLRVELLKYGVNLTGAGFYRMMSRLENAGIVQGEGAMGDGGRLYRLRQDAA